MSAWGWVGIAWGVACVPAALVLGAVMRLADHALATPVPPRREFPILPQTAVDRIFAEIVAVSLHDLGTFHG